MPIYYTEGTEVTLGDRVAVRLFLFMGRIGRVSYVPGISPLHREMEHHGIRQIGIVFDDGGAGGFAISSVDCKVVKSVTFLCRDNSAVAELPSEEAWT